MAIKFYLNGILQGESEAHAEVASPIVEVAAPAVAEEPAGEVSEKDALKAKLTEAGIDFDGRSSIEKLRELASKI